MDRQELEMIQDPDQRLRRLVELNVKEQVMNLCKTSIIQKAWASGDHLQVNHRICFEMLTLKGSWLGLRSGNRNHQRSQTGEGGLEGIGRYLQIRF